MNGHKGHLTFLDKISSFATAWRFELETISLQPFFYWIRLHWQESDIYFSGEMN